jgi:hypothetical protein
VYITTDTASSVEEDKHATAWHAENGRIARGMNGYFASLDMMM